MHFCLLTNYAYLVIDSTCSISAAHIWKKQVCYKRKKKLNANTFVTMLSM